MDPLVVPWFVCYSRHMMNNGDSGSQYSEKALKRRQQQAIAQDMKRRGGNPVTVSDLRQRHSVGNRPGTGFLSTLLHHG